MGMVVQHNMNAINAYNKLNANVAGLKRSSEKLASGYRINRAGDDAAGLAISEKMRAQIKSLNQSIRNSQDGINMIQTYEGAAQEAHSILQRMKELSMEAANGTYQNSVDREAIQLEFNQLNDELDQIADTDFNGVTMLNGGQMADGVRAVNGEYDYVLPDRVARKLGNSDVNILGSYEWDDIMANGKNSAAGGATGQPTTKANAAWSILNTSWTREPGKEGTQGPESIDVTFEYDAVANEWTAISASNGADKNKIHTEATPNGGFSISVADCGNSGTTDDYDETDRVATIVIDTTSLVSGDTITVTFNNPAGGIAAPTNADAKAVSGLDQFRPGADTANALPKDKANNMTVTINSKNAANPTGVVDDAKILKNPAIYSLFEKLDDATVTVNFAADRVTQGGDMQIKLGKTEVYSSAQALNVVNIDGVDFSFKFDAATNKLEIHEGADGTGDLLVTIQGQAQEAGTANLSTGSITFDIGIEMKSYNSAAVPSVEIAKTGAVSKSNSFEQANSPITYTDNLILQTGARTKDSVNFTFEYSSSGLGSLKSNLNISSRTDGLGTADLKLSTQEDANYAIDRIDNAINKVSLVRATFGATQNRLDHKIANVTVTAENITEAESAIRDTDMASEMMNYTKFNILQQAAQSMLAQANQQPQAILQLLG